MRIGFVSDIHEDIIRLRQAFDLLEKLRCDKLVCLGDIIGYSVPYYGFLASRDAHECLALVREKCSTAIIGNHDLGAIGRIPKHKAGFRYPKNWNILDFAAQLKISKGKIWIYHNDLPPVITKSDAKYLAHLPEFKVVNFGGVKVFLSHYAYPDIAGATTRDVSCFNDAKPQLSFQAAHGCTLGISGHEHTAGMVIAAEKRFEKIPFGKAIGLNENPTWLAGPCVANGTNANGIMVLDTDEMEIKTAPLNSKKHVSPEWRKL